MALIRIPKANLWTNQGEPYTHDLLIRTEFVTYAFCNEANVAPAPDEVEIHFGSGALHKFRSDDGEGVLKRLET